MCVVCCVLGVVCCVLCGRLGRQALPKMILATCPNTVWVLHREKVVLGVVLSCYVVLGSRVVLSPIELCYMVLSPVVLCCIEVYVCCIVLCCDVLCCVVYDVVFCVYSFCSRRRCAIQNEDPISESIGNYPSGGSNHCLGLAMARSELR